jgi:hypothetical protein
MAVLKTSKWLPWVLAAAPAAIAPFLPFLSIGDTRTSGAVILFAVTPTSFFVLLLMKRPWRARRIALRSLGTAGLLVLALLSVVAVVEGAPEFLKEHFGLFVDVDDYGPRAVIATPNGFVVVGDNAKGNAVVWLSADGQSWTRVPHSDVLSGLEIGDAAYTEFGIVMVGQDEVTGEAVAMVSPGGTIWQRAASLAVDPLGKENWGKPAALTSQERRLVLIGSVIGNDTVFWYASEPSAWSVGDPKPVFDRGKSAVDVVPVEGRFIAAMDSSRATIVRDTFEGALLFASESGQTWSEIASFKNAEISSLAPYQGGAVAVGYDRSEESAAVWVSANGVSWQEVPPTAALEQARMDVLVTGGVKLYALGRSLEDDAVIAWASVDAISWERVPVSFGDVVIRDAVMTDSGIIAAGVDLELDSAAFWTSPDGRTWQRVPHDEALFAVR